MEDETFNFNPDDAVDMLSLDADYNPDYESIAAILIYGSIVLIIVCIILGIVWYKYGHVVDEIEKSDSSQDDIRSIGTPFPAVKRESTAKKKE